MEWGRYFPETREERAARLRRESHRAHALEWLGVAAIYVGFVAMLFLWMGGMF